MNTMPLALLRPLKIIVTVKQVPDTHNVTENAMKPDGTVNRSALPTIFNPEDLNALEEALKIKDQLQAIGGNVHITALSMGPAKAIEVLKECLYRGADQGILLSDRKFAGADTLATSYALKKAIEKLGEYDLIFCGRQAIDGDTAQVGPQIAEKLQINQISSVVGVELLVNEKKVQVKRVTEHGEEILRSSFPVLLTVCSSANTPRFAGARKVMMFKNVDIQKVSEHYDETYLAQGEQAGTEAMSRIIEWNLDSVAGDPAQCGLGGSPTKVKSIQNVVLTTSEMRMVQNTEVEIKGLMTELINEHILG